MDFFKKMQNLLKRFLELYLNIFFWFFIKFSLQLVEFFFLTPLGLTFFGFFYCAAFFSDNTNFLFVFLKIFVSYLIGEIFFLSIFLKTKIIRKKVVEMYGMEIEEQVESLNTALFNAFILVLTIFLIDFLTLSFS